ncbi:hypothetical protein [Catellatospora sichuanensis]|uniref:hypothetical protein n=1 Tax=Catellatospora sichuanensis TaxID=1969805 RepID=UPI00164297EA|nr:hypothetical protein [Catellatospora sichuanensis]
MLSREDAAGRMLAWLAHPVSVAGLVLLLLNDHVFKAAWPGPVTGKLSDVAGMLMFPPILASVLALVLPRLPVRPLALASLVLTGLAFTASKAVPAGAEAAATLWSAVRGPAQFLADPSDLVALPALLLTGWAFRRTTALPDGTARSLRLLVLLPLGLLATVATTPPDYPNTVWVGQADGRLVRGGGDSDETYPRAGDLLYSNDAGLTWARDDESPQPTPTPGPDPSSPAVSPTPLVERLPDMLTSDCAGSVCYRVVPGELHVQRSTDGGRLWRTDWRVSGPAYARLVAGYPGLGDPAVHLSSLGLVVYETVGGQHVVLVANGRDGLLRRDEAGMWVRQDASVSVVSTPAAVLYYLVLVLAVMLLVLFMPLRRLRQSRPLGTSAQALWMLANILVPLAVTITALTVLYDAESLSGTSTLLTVLALAVEIGWLVAMYRSGGGVRAAHLAGLSAIAVTTGAAAAFALRRPIENAFIVLPDLSAAATGSCVIGVGAVAAYVLAGRSPDRQAAVVAPAVARHDE